MSKRAKNVLYNILLTVCIAVFAVSAFFLVRYVLESRKSQGRFDELAQMATRPPQSPSEPAGTDPSAASEKEYPGCEMVIDPKTGEEIPVLYEYVELFKQNFDLVGWMQIEDTKLNYPVMQTPGKKDYYLRRDFDKEHSSHGSLYVRGLCDVFAPSDNLTIYGHNMRDGSMFAVLHKYESKEFWQDHPIVIFSTLSERHEYEIFSVFKTSATEGKGFPYHLFVDAFHEQQFDDYVQTCKELSMYDTEITPVYGDKLITLSTCDYTQENGRLVVVARRLPEFLPE